MQKKSVVKPPELLKHSNSSKNNVQIKQISSVYSNKIIPASFTTRVMTVPKKASRVNYISVTNSVKSPTKNGKQLRYLFDFLS